MSGWLLLQGCMRVGHSSSLMCSFWPVGDQNAGGEFGPASGAYIFRPDGLVVPTGLLQLHVARGPVVTEVHQVFLDYTSATIR